VKVIETGIPGLVVIEPDVFSDQRGFFIETWSRDRYREAGVREDFVQDNLSFSRRGVLRGLHFQNPKPQGKLVYVLQGEVFDVAVDIRRGSPTFGQWYGVILSADNKRQLYVPPGFAHGFCVTSEMALFAYKCTNLYDPNAEGVIAWNDPDLGIDWPVDDPELSAKDADAMRLHELPEGRLIPYAGGQS
jgi:dTDP-4-dehydrorhamnose 3,5-epimerase